MQRIEAKQLIFQQNVSLKPPAYKSISSPRPSVPKVVAIRGVHVQGKLPNRSRLWITTKSTGQAVFSSFLTLSEEVVMNLGVEGLAVLRQSFITLQISSFGSPWAGIDSGRLQSFRSLPLSQPVSRWGVSSPSQAGKVPVCVFIERAVAPSSAHARRRAIGFVGWRFNDQTVHPAL